MRVEGFDGLELVEVAAYRLDRLKRADRLRDAIVCTRELGAALTGDMLARNRRTITTIGRRNPSPHYDELFLTFLDYPEWIGPVDHDLRQLRADLSTRPTVYQHVVRELAREPKSRLFELNVYSILRRHFSVLAYPRLPDGKEADVQVTVDDRTITIECTVLGESRADRDEYLRMRQQGRTHWVGARDIDAEPRRLLRKIVEEMAQTSPSTPNVMVVAIHAPSTAEFLYDSAVCDIFKGTTTLAANIAIDAALVARLDSIVLCSRHKVDRIFVNPVVATPFQLEAATRQKLLSALEGESFRTR